MNAFRIAAAFLVLSTTSCSSVRYQRSAAQYDQRSPEREATADFKAGDYRVYSAMGLGHYFPGLEPTLGKRLAAKYGERMLPRTTDALSSYAELRYISAATGFAARYNRQKATLLQPRHSPR